jgi:hypothetical protein
MSALIVTGDIVTLDPGRPRVEALALVDGRVAAAWCQREGRIAVEAYEPLPPGVEEERERLEAFHS